MNWTWDPKDRKVQIGEPEHPEVGVSLGWTPASVAELRAFEYELEKSRRVYLTLESARDAFEGGRAKYENASAEVRHLLTEANLAAMELVEAMGRIDRWFESPVSPLFQGDADGFLRFCKDWIGRQGPPEGVVGNSSRGPSASLRKRPPGTAATARGSSSAPAASPSASGSGRTNGSRRKIAPDARTS